MEEKIFMKQKTMTLFEQYMNLDIDAVWIGREKRDHPLYSCTPIGANIFGWDMAFTQIPQAVSEVLLGITDNKYVILLIMNVILLIAGTFMDVTPAILIFTPLFLPIVKNFGMHPVQFGLILVYNLCIGNITPPVGNTLFVGIKVGNTTLGRVIPYMLLYYGAILTGLMFITYVPMVSLWLPKAAGLI